MGSCQTQRIARPPDPSPADQKPKTQPYLQIVLKTADNTRMIPKPKNSQLKSQILNEHFIQKQIPVSIEPQKQSLNQQQNQQPEIKQQHNQYRSLLLLFQECYQAYHEHDVDTSHQHLQQFHQLKSKIMNENSISQQSLQQMLQKQLQKWKAENSRCKIHSYDKKLMKQIQVEYQDILHYQDEINRGGWQLKQDVNGIKTSTRREGTTVGVLMEADINIPFQIFISVLTEIDLYKQFIPFNQVSRQQKVFSRNCRVGYNLNNYPFLTKREAYFQGIGYSRLKAKQQLFLFTRSIHNRPDLQEHLGFKVQTSPEYVQLTYKYFVVKYKPLAASYGKLTMAFNADMELAFIPLFVMQYIVKDFAKSFLQSLVDISQRFENSQWEQKVNKNPELFSFFKRQIDNYLKDGGFLDLQYVTS